MKTAIVTGGSSGLGWEIHKALAGEGFEVTDWSLAQGVDIRSRASVEAALADWSASHSDQHLDILINCAGVNHIEFIDLLEEEDWDRIMDTNAKGIFLVSQALLGKLGHRDGENGGTILNIVSNAAHVPMTHSLAYNASKGAAKIMTAQMSRELIKTHGITVFSISPNKLKGTGMSNYIDMRAAYIRGWTEGEAKGYQLASLPAGRETDPATLAEFVAFLLSTKERHRYFAGCDIPYGL